MKARLKKGLITKPKPFKIKIDPNEFRSGITIPVIKYEVSEYVDFEEVFKGMVMPMPRVLISYLNHAELMVVTFILEETIHKGESTNTLNEMAKKLQMSIPTISNTLYKLRKIGFLLEGPNGLRGGGRVRKLNFKAIQRLNDLAEGENPDVFLRIRKATQKTDIFNLTKEDIRRGYDNYALPPEHDPAEEEEYD